MQNWIKKSTQIGLIAFAGLAEMVGCTKKASGPNLNAKITSAPKPAKPGAPATLTNPPAAPANAANLAPTGPGQNSVFGQATYLDGTWSATQCLEIDPDVVPNGVQLPLYVQENAIFAGAQITFNSLTYTDAACTKPSSTEIYTSWTADMALFPVSGVDASLYQNEIEIYNADGSIYYSDVIGVSNNGKQMNWGQEVGDPYIKQ